MPSSVSSSRTWQIQFRVSQRPTSSFLQQERAVFVIVYGLYKEEKFPATRQSSSSLTPLDYHMTSFSDDCSSLDLDDTNFDLILEPTFDSAILPTFDSAVLPTFEPADMPALHPINSFQEHFIAKEQKVAAFSTATSTATSSSSTSPSSAASSSAAEIELLSRQVAEMQMRFRIQQDELRVKTHQLHQERRRSRRLSLEMQKSDALLENILPSKIVENIRQSKQPSVEHFDNVTTIFADIVGFSQICNSCEEYDVLKMLNSVFSTMDDIAEECGIVRIKTIGDSYMAVAGCPEQCVNHASRVARFALRCRESFSDFRSPDGNKLKLRYGIHTGSVVAGVLGKKKFHYDLWGSDVNIASRMEQNSEANCICVSPQLQEMLKSEFLFAKREPRMIKGSGEMITYFLLKSKQDVEHKK